MFDFLDRWKDKITQNVSLRLELMKLNFIQRASGILSYFIFMIICLLLALCILLFLGMGMGEFFSSLTGSRGLGYILTATIYIVLFFVLLLARKNIIRRFVNVFIGVMTEDVEEDEESGNKSP